MILAAHQINLFPFEGIAEKARASDVFVLLGQVQFSPGNYHNRFHQGGRWFTLSVHRGLEPLVEKRYADPFADFERIKRRMGPRYASLLSEFDDCISEQLAETNGAIIWRLFRKLGIGVEIAWDWPTDLRGTDRLVDLCKRFGADRYLSGPSGPKYLDLDVFEREGIRVIVQEPVGRRAAVELLEKIR